MIVITLPTMKAAELENYWEEVEVTEDDDYQLYKNQEIKELNAR